MGLPSCNHAGWKRRAGKADTQNNLRVQVDWMFGRTNARWQSWRANGHGRTIARVFAALPRHTAPALIGLGIADLAVAAHFAVAGPMAAALIAALTGIMFVGMAIQVASQREVDKLMASMCAVNGNRPFTSLARPRLAKAREIYDAAAIWSARQEIEMSRLRDRAQRDSMTMLPNRWYFKRLVEAAIARTPPGQSAGSMLLLDVDSFKAINDSLGHEAGDQTLMHVSRRISMAVAANDPGSDNVIVGRLGGDEFTIFAPSITTVDAARRLGERLQRLLAEPAEIDAGTASTNCSIGIAIARPGEKLTSILTSADIAMYDAKMAGKNRFCVFSDAMAQESLSNKLVETSLRTAFSDRNLTIHYQPQFSCATGKIVSAEALLRWHHPVLGQISPTRFVPIAERLGLIGIVGDWVLEEAARTIARLAAQGTPLGIAVNISPIQLRRGDFPATVKAILRRCDVPAHLLEIEITESAAMIENADVLQGLASLRDCGVRISIDDFGMGYSNLARLVSLPIDRIKIDKSMIDEISDHMEIQLLVKTIIDMSISLGVDVVAEGIEKPDQLKLLTAFGCDIGQGFLLSRPVTSDVLAEMLKTGSPLHGLEIAPPAATPSAGGRS